MGFRQIKDQTELEHEDAYVSVYHAMYGWKDIFYSRDEECGNMFTPWNTGYFQYPDRLGALPAALMWAHSEDVPFYMHEVTPEEQDAIDLFIKEAAAHDEMRASEEHQRHCMSCKNNEVCPLIDIDDDIVRSADDDIPF